jgi:hypothetical protein
VSEQLWVPRQLLMMRSSAQGNVGGYLRQWFVYFSYLNQDMLSLLPVGYRRPAVHAVLGSLSATSNAHVVDYASG